MLVEVPLDGHFPVNEGGGGVVAAPVCPRGEGQKVYVVVYDVHKGGVNGGKLEGLEVLVEVTIRLVGGGVFAHRGAMVCRRLGGLLSVQFERYRWEGRGSGVRAEAEDNK